jgi:hypothetical protein
MPVAASMVPSYFQWLEEEAVGQRLFCSGTGYVKVLSPPELHNNGNWMVQVISISKYGEISGTPFLVRAGKITNLPQQGEVRTTRNRKPPNHYICEQPAVTRATKRKNSPLNNMPPFERFRQAMTYSLDEPSIQDSSSNGSDESFQDSNESDDETESIGSSSVQSEALPDHWSNAASNVDEVSRGELQPTAETDESSIRTTTSWDTQ